MKVYGVIIPGSLLSASKAAAGFSKQKNTHMETTKQASHPRPVITQTRNNTTLWIGHLQSDPNDHFGGQTFNCPVEGTVDNIQVYSSAVQNSGELILSLHRFDTLNKTWGPAIGSSSLSLHKGEEARWIRFSLPSVLLHKNETYGFRLQAHGALVALGEAATGTSQPFTFGHEWNGDSRDEKGHFFTYFSLAFKVEMCA